MSDFRGLGGVSATLRTLLADRMELPDGIASLPVTVGLPPFTAKDNEPHKEDPRLNIFLYRVTENGYLQNQDLPGRAPGSAYGHPPLSLNLHYLITAYGNLEIATVNGSLIFDDTTAHFLLGSAMRVLHDIPVVTPRLTTTRPPSGNAVLHPSLHDEIELIRSTIEPLTLEDITKVWTALSLRYRVSASYVVNVVRIESRRPPRIVRPVGQPVSPTVPPLPTDAPTPGPMVHVLTISTPTITDLRVRRVGTTAEQPFPYARIDDTLVLRGTNLSGPVTSVKVGEVVVPALLATADRVEAKVPNLTAGSAAIPPELLLQPGVRTASVILRNPLIPHRVFTSNEAVFMLVPAVNPATLLYAAGPPRTLRIDGTRLIVVAPIGETLIGRAVVPRSAYRTATPTQIVVPVPDELPTRAVNVIVGAPLPDPIPVGAGVKSLTTTIAGVSATATANLPATIARSSASGIVAQLIHDASPQDLLFTATRVTLWGDRLVIVPGGLTHSITVTSGGGSTLAAALGLTAAQPAGATSALVSGALASVPVLSAVSPRIRMKVGAQPPITIDVPRALSLDDLSSELQTAINGASALAEYANALVATTGTQLLVIPGAAGAVSFDPAPGDDTTVGELQLHARFAVRVRVNGAESVDEAFVELPQ